MDFVIPGANIHSVARLLLLSHHFSRAEKTRKEDKKKKNQYLRWMGRRRYQRYREKPTDKRSEKSVSTLTQDEVVLCQLCVSDLFVQSAAWVEIHIGHEAADVEFLLDLQH